MYIQPQGIFKIIKGVPLSNDYLHTIRFEDASQQYSYFNSHTVASYIDFSYIRQQRTVKVPALADNIYDCNYCMFKNVGFGDKWFYAFITDIEYINNEVSAIQIELDYMQTWLFDFEVGNSFVLREHVNDDTIGLHTVEEDIPFGGNVAQDSNNYYFTVKDTDGIYRWSVVVQATPNTSGDLRGTASGNIFDNIYTGSNYYVSPMDATNINLVVNNLLAEGYTIQNIYMLPTVFLSDGQIYIANGTVGSRPTKYEQPIISQRSYTPKNNKLFTYPYTYMRVLNNVGSHVDYKWENFTDGSYSFNIQKTITGDVKCVLVPSAYECANNREYELTISDFPVCSWSENAFLSYLGSRGVADAIKGVLNLGTAGAIGGTAGLVGEASSIISSGTEAISRTFLPKLAKGNSSSANLNVSSDRFGYTFITMGIKPEYAEIVDEYFTRFGYKINRYKVPNLYGRKWFNYVQTKGCYILGDIPDKVRVKLEQIFDNGITLWHTTDVGNYALDNDIIIA